jgi:putative sigma-54 modulation protein
MKIEFTGRHMEFTPALKAHVEEHFAKLDQLFEGKPVRAHVIIEVERGMHRSEIVMNWMNEVLTAETSTDDMYQSLSQTVGKIEKQARKIKDRVIDKSHKARSVASVTAPSDNVEFVAAPFHPQIIEVDMADGKPMSPEEAAEELDSGGQQFVVFRNTDNQGVSVLFRRKDGHYGLVTP